MFDNYKTSRYFSKTLLSIEMEVGTVSASKFADEVKALFDKKTISEEGEYTNFKVTSDDIDDILLKLNLES